MQRERKMRENIGPSQQFVSVIFDFEHDAADESDHEGGPLPGSRNIPGAGKSGKSGNYRIQLGPGIQSVFGGNPRNDHLGKCLHRSKRSLGQEREHV